MGSATRCHFVNPKYDGAGASRATRTSPPCPRCPTRSLIALNPLRAAAVTQQAADVACPAVLIPGGGVVEGGEAAAQMQAEVRAIAIRHGMAVIGPNCMGMIDLTTNSPVYIGDVYPWLPRGGVAGIAQSGSRHRRVHPLRHADRLQPDHRQRRRGRPRRVRLRGLLPRGSRRPTRSSCSSRGSSGPSGSSLSPIVRSSSASRSSRSRSAAGTRPRRRPSPTSGSLAGERRVTDAALAAAGVVRCADLDELLEAAELHAGCRRLGRSVGRGRTGLVTVSTGEASLIADLAPRTGLDCRRARRRPGGDPR